MKAVLTVNNEYLLVPDKKSMEKLMRVTQPGIEIEGNLFTDRPRSLPQHRRYFARLNSFSENIPEGAARVFWVSVLRDLFTIETIDTDVIHELIKKVVGVGSVSFDRMAQDDACDFFRRADELIDRWKSAMEANTQ